MMLLAAVLFIVTYILLLALPKYRAPVALVGGAAFVAAGILTPAGALSSVDWNVLLMIAGTMGLVGLFIESGMPARMANTLLQHMPNVRIAIVALAVFAGLISAFIDNVTTEPMVAPAALAVAKRMKASPVPVLIAIAVSSNLQGAATLVGDTTSILLGGAAGMDCGNLALVYAAVVWGSVLCSAFIDNIPYVAAMLPVVAQVSSLLGVEPTLLYFGLLIGATLGGNLTPVGASANITAIGILRREGYEVKNSDFLRIGLPFTLAAVCTGYALLWLIWA